MNKDILPEFALEAFEVLFALPDENGRLKSSSNAPLPALGNFLKSLNTELSPGIAGAADYLNLLVRDCGKDDFADLLAREIFDALTALNIFPDDLNDAPMDSDGAFLLENILTLFNFLREYDCSALPGANRKLLPRARKIFRTLPEDAAQIIGLLKKSDPFSSGRVFCYRQHRFIAVEPSSVREINKFYGYPGVRSAYRR